MKTDGVGSELRDPSCQGRATPCVHDRSAGRTSTVRFGARHARYCHKHNSAWPRQEWPWKLPLLRKLVYGGGSARGETAVARRPRPRTLSMSSIPSYCLITDWMQLTGESAVQLWKLLDLQAVMARGDKIVACFNELIKEKGEKAVLYQSIKTAMKPPWLQGWRPRVITIPR